MLASAIYSVNEGDSRICRLENYVSTLKNATMAISSKSKGNLYMNIKRLWPILLASLALITILSIGCTGNSDSSNGNGASTPAAGSNGVDLPSISTAPSTPANISTPKEVPDDLKTIWETYSILKRQFVDQSKVDPSILSEAAIKGMLDVLKDPYTSYIDPKSYQLEISGTTGKFEGIGAEVNMTADGRLMIVAPMPGSPAEQAGIKPGDTILEVDGKSVKGLSLMESVLRIRGQQGTSVQLLLKPLLNDQTRTVEIVRGVISMASVNMNMTQENFAYIHLRVFYENTPAEFKQILQDAKDKGAKGIILDMRNNPGGLLTSAVNVASQFLKNGLVLYEITGNGRRTDWAVQKGGLTPDLPMVVLVNGFSASGSEVVAGALQDQGRATIVGAKTFGKGSVNIFQNLSNGGGIYLSFGHWYTPNGRLIEGKGLDPDVAVNPSANPREDAQFDKAVEILLSKISGTQK